MNLMEYSVGTFFNILAASRMIEVPLPLSLVPVRGAEQFLGDQPDEAPGRRTATPERRLPTGCVRGTRGHHVDDAFPRLP